ncbi:hypothetical protein [Dokdonella sp.]|uniref:hypothetical protein n=1 Tax=Dokdonella sp. TaxID=2291710 RepID=UPI003C55AE0D
MSFSNRFGLAMLQGALGLFIWATPSAAHDVKGPAPSAGLGALEFPTSSTSAQAQAAFERGALLLHLFEYEDAALEFVKAQSLQPDFVMAVWGEAMTHNHPLWNQLDEAAGQKALAKLGKTPAERAAKASNAREKGYLEAVEILYSGDGTKPARDERYLGAMKKLAESYPDDNQAQLFHALALQGRTQGVRNVPDYLRAAEISKRVFVKNPLNPGAAHYWIHGMDDPEHAEGAIEAARALSKIAPDAGHAQHMTSHIFIALGLWDDLVQANEEATRVLYAHARANGKPVLRCNHYSEWLEYGYYQQGRHREADQLLLSCDKSGKAALAELKGKVGEARLAERYAGSLPTMRATAIIESGNWDGMAVKLAMPEMQQIYAQAATLFTNGYAAAGRGNLAAADSALSSLMELIASNQSDPGFLALPDYLAIFRDDLEAVIAYKRGETEKAMALVRGAAARLQGMAFDFGPPPSVKLPQELLGEMLLADGKPGEAAAAFTASLKLAPLRAMSMLGLARAEAAAGNTQAAAETYTRLVAIWHSADSELPGLLEAQKFLEQHPL